MYFSSNSFSEVALPVWPATLLKKGRDRSYSSVSFTFFVRTAIQ